MVLGAPREFAFAGVRGGDLLSRPTRRPCCVCERLRAALAHVTSQFPHQVRVLREDAALQCVALLARHRAHVEGICGLFVLRLLAAVDELHVGDRRSSRLPGVLVGEAAPQSGQNLRPIIVERAGCAFSYEGPAGPQGPAVPSSGYVMSVRVFRIYRCLAGRRSDA